MSWEKVEAALSLDRTVDLTSSWLKVRSESGAAAQGGRWIRDRLEDLGFRVETYSIEGYEGGPLVVGELEFSSDGPGLLLDAHHDTDPVTHPEYWSVDPFGGEVRDGYLYGRGAVDSKGPGAAMLAACEALVKSGVSLKGRIIYASPSDGELAMRGGDLLVDAGYIERTEWIYSAECTSNETIEIAWPGLTLWKVAVRGRPAHPTKPEEGINAITKMASIINAIETGELRFRHDPWKWMEPRVTVNAIRTVPKGWEIPDNCDLVLNVLSVPGMTPMSIKEDIESFIDRLQEKDRELSADVKIIPRGFYIWRRPGEVAEDDPAVLALDAASQEILGRPLRTAAFLGGYVPGAAASTVADRTSLFPRPPCIVFGPGDFSLAHAPDERVSITELHDGARIYARAFHRLLGGDT